MSHQSKLILLISLVIGLAGALIPTDSLAKSERQKVIDFDEALIEGMNKRPLDSLNQLGGGNNRGKRHLYRKRASFRGEIRSTLQEVRFTP